MGDAGRTPGGTNISLRLPQRPRDKNDIAIIKQFHDHFRYETIWF